ncbi:hypothetical protein DYQ86_27070 [Acidobacteria bacterium AB60]|nr:hypothetical protein DYQ86_27070 [Acidobacteria bacterium AB60]
MALLRFLALATTIGLSRLALPAAPLEPLHARCSIGPSESEQPGAFRIRVYEGDEDCFDGRHCDSNFNHDPFTRLTGITRSDLSRNGAQLTATLAAEAGTFTCSGRVMDGVLHGNAVFTPDAAFVERMEKMGFSGYTSEKLEAYAFLNVESAWVHGLQQTGVKGMTGDNLLAMRIFNVEPAYIASITALGYPMPDADKLIAFRVHKVDPEEVRQIRALGYQPSLDDLIQIRIFHVTPEFIRRMQGRGFKDLTLAKLVQIKIFKLDE